MFMPNSIRPNILPNIWPNTSAEFIFGGTLPIAEGYANSDTIGMWQTLWVVAWDKKNLPGEVLFNGTEFNEEINSNNLDMMWITFAGNDFENTWFRLESEELGWIRLHENPTIDGPIILSQPT